MTKFRITRFSVTPTETGIATEILEENLISTFGGKELVDVKKIKKRILEKRKRKTNKTTSADMRDMFGY